VKIIVLYFAITLWTSGTEGEQLGDNLFEIVKLSRQHDYYIIYATKDNLKYKIVSKKTTDDCSKIRTHQKYELKLTELKFLGGGEVNCLSFDKRTVICKCDDKDCVYGLFMATNLRGLCIIDE
jgi:hypothetical protein